MKSATISLVLSSVTTGKVSTCSIIHYHCRPDTTFIVLAASRICPRNYLPLWYAQGCSTPLQIPQAPNFTQFVTYAYYKEFDGLSSSILRVTVLF